MFEPSTLPLAELDGVLDRVLAEDPAGLDGVTAVIRARALLQQAERLQLAAVQAVRDVDSRELYALDGAGSTTGWLRAQPAGDRGQLALARQLDAHPHVAHALAAGQVSLRTAAVVCRALARVSALSEVPDAQLHGVLLHGVRPLLHEWAGAARERDEELTGDPDKTAEDLLFAARAGERDRVLAHAVRDSHLPAADRLAEPFVLLARVLAPRGLPDALRTLVDALEPEVEATPEDPFLTLRQRVDGLWDLHAVLDAETGTLLDAELTARKKARTVPDDEAAEAPSPADHWPATVVPTGDVDTPSLPPQPVLPLGPLVDEAFGQVGPGLPSLPPVAWRDLPGAPVEGEPGMPGGIDHHSTGRRHHDAFVQLVADLAGVPPGSGIPPPAHLTVTATLATVLAEPGAPPAELDTGRRPVPLTPSQLARLSCDAALSAVVLDAAGSSVGASGQHRHATARERRALRALWGASCAVNGCDRTATVPHHVEMFSRSRRTRLADLVPLCTGHHHDVHDAHRTLRLRDGRLIHEDGWADRTATAAA